MVTRSAVESFIANNDLLRASALTYTVALSIVPVLALAFSVLKGFGEGDAIQGLIQKYLAVGGAGEQLIKYIQNVNAAALGSAGAAFLLITVISTMGTIEQAFNTIFHVPQSRSYLRKFSDYLSVLFTVPLLITAALTVTAIFSVRISHAPIFSALSPYLFTWGGFFFLFVFFPYTEVKYLPALIGSFVTAVLFQLAQWGYVKFQVGVANYHAIYGALATVPIFLVWVYLAWSIVLFGAEITAAIQRGAHHPSRDPRSPDFPIAAGLHILLRLAGLHQNGGAPITLHVLALELAVSEASLRAIVDKLKDAGYVVEAVESRGLFLVRDPETIVLADALERVVPLGHESDTDPRVEMVLGRINSLRDEVLRSLKLSELAKTPPVEAAHEAQTGKPAA